VEKGKNERQDKRTENIKERTQAKIEKKLKKKVMQWLACVCVVVCVHPYPIVGFPASSSLKCAKRPFLPVPYLAWRPLLIFDVCCVYVTVTRALCRVVCNEQGLRARRRSF
jgi:hypothetical protein